MEEYYINLINTLTIGASIISNDGRILFVNDAYPKGIGETKDFMLHSNMFSPEYDKKLSMNIFRQVMKKRTEVRESQVYINEQGLAYAVTVYEKPVFKDNEIEYVLAYAESIILLGRADEKKDLNAETDTPVFICESPAMRQLAEQAKIYAHFPANILLLGETGVGKDVMAEYIHRNSDRRNKPFVTVNCAAISDTLIESELFGYENGAFTGAHKKGKKGLIEQADGGILFLDEINSLPLSLQGKLLRAIEKKMILRVGATEEQQVDFRLITASNENLETCVKNKTFREDLYYRISVLAKKIPPLRERREDIIPLAVYFIQIFCKRYHMNIHLSKQQLFDELLNYDWPGNVRELKNYIERFVITGESSLEANSCFPLLLEEFNQNPPAVHSLLQIGTLKERLTDYEREIIKETLKNCRSKGMAAKELGIDPAVLSRKIVKYGL